MKRPQFGEGILLALGAALVAGAAGAVLPPLFGGVATLRMLTAGLGLAYLLYLLSRSAERTGRIVTLAGWLALAGGGWFLLTDPLSYLLLHLGMVWLVRSLHHQPGPLAALADLGLNGLALMAGLWAYLHAGSLFLAVWSFFLVQALFVGITSFTGQHPGRGDAPRATPEPDPFRTASRSAEAALRRLSAQR